MTFSLPANVAPRGLPLVAERLPAAIEKPIREVNPEKIILFRSYAYGNPTSDSDVDLPIIWDADKPRRERAVAISLLLYARLFPVDIIVKTPREIEEETPHNFPCKRS